MKPIGNYRIQTCLGPPPHWRESKITKSLEKDKSIFFLSADFGAQALDELRKRSPNNFLHCGISEQAMLDIAAGLALEGKKVFVYAMAPFLALRSLEQTKCGAGLMNLPICLLSVGIGLGYADAGPTHYSTEDFACFRAIVGSSIYTPSDSATTKLIANETGFNENPIFVKARPQEVKEATCSANKARKILGYKTKTTLKQSIKLTAEFIKKRGTKPFIYNLPIEIVSEITPETWTKKKI